MDPATIGTLIVIITLITLGYIGYLAAYKGIFKQEWKTKVKSKLVELDNEIQSNDLLRMKTALIDADKLLDHTLKNLGYKGETLGERLKNSKPAFKYQDYDNIWKAHKTRNQLVHEIDFTMSQNDLKTHYQSLRKGISVLI